MDKEIYLPFRCWVPETDVNCVLWPIHVDFFIVTAVGSKNNGTNEGS